MSDDQTFQPIFGPNGAVMNAPSMTPQMRAKLEAAAQPPTVRQILRELLFFGFWGGLGLLAFAFAPEFSDLWKSSPWWGGFFTGVVVALISVGWAWRTYREMTRWELLGFSPATERLQMPGWGRWSLAATSILSQTMYCIYAVGFITDFDRAHGWLWLAVLLLAGASVLAHSGLVYAARKLGWTIWRVPA